MSNVHFDGIRAIVKGVAPGATLAPAYSHLSHYVYTVNDPVSYTDPIGLGRIPGYGQFTVSPCCSVKTAANFWPLEENKLGGLHPPIAPGATLDIEAIYWPGNVLKVPDNCNLFLDCDSAGNFKQLRTVCLTAFSNRPQRFQKRNGNPLPPGWPPYR